MSIAQKLIMYIHFFIEQQFFLNVKMGFEKQKKILQRLIMI